MLNVNQFLKQAQNLQKKMQESQEELAKEEFAGKAGGGLVSTIINGSGFVTSINIDTSLCAADEKEMLEDLLIASFNDARKKLEARLSETNSSNLGGMSLPPGFKMPF